MTPIWKPSAERIRSARLTDFASYASGLSGRAHLSDSSVNSYPDYSLLYKWSLEHREEFWVAIARYFRIQATDLTEKSSYGLDLMQPPVGGQGPHWFTHSRLNFAENILRHVHSGSLQDQAAIISWNEQGRRAVLTFGELYNQVAQLAAYLRGLGVSPGDRVAGYLPNLPETVIAMLATTSIGAIWSSCSPDFGVQGIFDRFNQVKPKVLFAADGYLYSGKEIDCLERVSAIVDQITSIEQVVIVPYRGRDLKGAPANSITWDKAVSGDVTGIEFEQLPFDHPVYIMYSSGTTGLPKCMVHGAGGTTLQHAKELGLHTDIGPGDRLFYYTTCGWMMWNWMVSALGLGAALVLYDGAPLSPSNTMMWDLVEQEKVTAFGTSAKYLATSEKLGLRPLDTHDLASLRTILSTGSPLADHSYDYVYSQVKTDVHLASISGGTDIISCFALGNPTLPVYRGELQCRGLGMAVDIFDSDGNPVRNETGELVCTLPFPSMPVAFWDDTDGGKYRSAYFEGFPNVWCHGDWAKITANDGLIIYGRSDATLNPSGVRIGTAEIYRQVEQLPEVIESVAVGREIGEGVSGDVEVVLFVRLRDGVVPDETLETRIRQQIRNNTSPLHVPKRLAYVADIPRTISGKISEIAVREVIHGRAVKNTDALANPESLQLFRPFQTLWG